MSIPIRVALVALVLVALPSLVSAQDEPRPDRPDAAALFDRLDSNKDGAVTKDEIPQERRRYFERLLRAGDKNEDGKLSREELAAALQGQPRPTAPAGQPDRRRAVNADQYFSRLDTNNDGKLDKNDEIPPQLRERLRRADTDGDGAVSKQEFQRAARYAQPAPDGRPGAGTDGALFRALDADRDGRISAEELAGATAALKKLDRNGDGALTRFELSATRPAAATQRNQAAALERRVEATFSQRDKNQDGKISKEEAPEGWQRFYDRIDTNGDGELDKAEVTRILRRFIDRSPDGARPRRPADSDRRQRPGNDRAKPRETDKPRDSE